MPLFFSSFGSNLISTVTAFPLGIPCFLPDLHHPCISSWHSLVHIWSSPSLHFLLAFPASYLIFTILSFPLGIPCFLPDLHHPCISLAIPCFLPDLHHPCISSCHSLVHIWSSPSLHFLMPFFGSYLIFTILAFPLAILWFISDLHRPFIFSCRPLVLTWYLL